MKAAKAEFPSGAGVANTAPAATPVSYGLSAAYAAPAIGAYFLVTPIAVLQGVYAKYFGLSLTTIAIVILIARVFDAVTDPLIGYWSDRQKRRGGSRKVLIAIGGAGFVVCGYFLYAPPENVSAAYFLILFLAFFLMATLIEIPHLAWGGELASDLKSRSRIYTARHIAVYLGTLLFFAVPLLPVFDTTEVTPETLRWSAIGMGALMLPMLWFALTVVPDGSVGTHHNEKPQWRAVFANRPLLMFLAVYFFAGLGLGMWYGLLFIFVDSFLGLGAHVSAVYITAVTVALAATAGWHVVAVTWGKKRAWCAGMTLSALAAGASAFLAPGEGALAPLYAIVIVSQIGMASLIVGPSLLADIADYGRLKFRVNNTASYFSAYALVTKGNAAIGAALGLAIAGVAGFDPASETQTDAGVFGLRLAIGLVPALITFAAAALIIFLPMTRRRHDIIRRRLDARDRRAADGF